MVNDGHDRQKLSTIRMIVIGSGDFGLNVYWVCTSVFLLFYYTDTLGLSPATAGAIYMAALIWDAAIDPLVGSMTERTRSRLGRYRPYLLFGTAPLAFAFSLVFVLPTLDPRLGTVLALASLFLFRTLYALVAIPYATLFARVTADSGERATMAGIRMFFGFASGILVAGVSLPLSRWLGGWGVLSLLYASLACLALWSAAAAIGEEPVDAGPPPPGALVAAKAMLSNRPLLLILAIVLLTSFSGTFFSKNVLYFFKYARHDPDFGGTALAASAGLAALCSPLWARLARRLGKKAALLIGLDLGVAGLLLWLFARAAPYPVLFAALALTAAGTSATYVCFWSMIPDTIEFGEWHSGVRTEGTMFGTVIFVQKAALGLAAGGLGIALGLIGFLPNAQQSPLVLDRLVLLMTLIPIAGMLLMVILALLYPIDARTHRALIDAIARRRAGRSSD